MSASAPARPEFHDPSLRQALDRGAPAIETFTSRLDKLSADIKNLEGYLDRSAVRINVCVRFPSDSQEGNEYGPAEYLEWGKGEPDRWRVLYYRTATHPEIDRLVQVDHGPLIEASVPVRVRARGALPLLLHAVADAAMLGERTISGTPSAGREHYKNRWGIDEEEPAVPSEPPPPSDEDIPF
jgi:hypothetical protein